MPGTTDNNLTNPAVPNNNEVDTLLIEKFTAVVHEQYNKGENLLSDFEVQEVVGTNSVSNKYIGETELQVLTPGQEPSATDTEFNKNRLVVDTVVLGRNTVAMLHDVQNDFKVMEKLAKNQMEKIKTMEDQMVLQQLLYGGFTGGVYDPYANTITGGVSRVKGQGVAIKVELKDDLTQASDPYQLISSYEIAIMGLVIQKVPLANIKATIPLNDFSLLVDYGYIAQTEGGSNETENTEFSGLTGRIKGYNIPVRGSVQFSQMQMNPNDGRTHHLLSKPDNGYRYDVTADMQKSHAIIYGTDALLAGRTIGLQADIFFDKKSKTNYIDSWFAEGCIPDRYDNIAIVSSTAAANNTNVLTKAKGKAKATKTYS